MAGLIGTVPDADVPFAAGLNFIRRAIPVDTVIKSGRPRP